MQTGIKGSEDRLQAWQRLVGENTNWTWVQDTQSSKNFEVFIDLDFDNSPESLVNYAANTQTLFLLSAANTTLEMAFKNARLKYEGQQMFGINAIPTFLERNTLEFTNPFELNTEILFTKAKSFGWSEFEEVKSRVGLVTPRIVFMIINEAYFTFQEGTASKADIDTAMKLGTNYPKGPFQWCNEAGIANVYSMLQAVYEDTKDERYKICPQLKTEWLQSNIQG
jgi:3-hydroxybutyryl-CoA dehydrogenase